MTYDVRLFHRRAAATGNALSLTVDRRVRRTSRDVDEAERSRRLASVSAGRRIVRHTGTLAPDHVGICMPEQLRPYKWQCCDYHNILQ